VRGEGKSECARDEPKSGVCALPTQVRCVSVRKLATAWAGNENGGVELIGGAAGGAY
jgi:hypothetical protein